MKWVVDTTDRFEWRPYYDQVELDNECEQLVSKFLMTRYGKLQFPLSNDDLSVLIEGVTSDLDLYADLSHFGEDVEGMTDFFPHQKPSVKIARELSLDTAKNNRLRTTLAHEYGHVKFHTFLWDYNRETRMMPKLSRKHNIQKHHYQQVRQHFSTNIGNKGPESSVQDNNTTGLFYGFRSGSCFRCKQARMIDAPLSDWMEWQAGYAGGAVLMPLSALGGLVQQVLVKRNGHSWVQLESEKAQELITRAAEMFAVSSEASRVRLLKTGFLQAAPGNMA